MNPAASIEVRDANPSESERAVGAMVMAFTSDPLMRWFWPEADDYLRNFPRLVRFFGGRAFDHGTAHASADFGGAALWLPPGVGPDGDRVTELFQETLTDPTRSQTLTILERMEECHTTERHLYLAFIGVDVAHQNKGIGSVVIRRGLVTCDADGLHAYLESSNPANVPFYQRHGFEVTQEIRVGDAPPITAMLRSPR